MIQDTLELDFLSQLQAKRSAELRVQEQQAWGLKQLMNRMTGTLPITNNIPVTALDVAAAPAPTSTDTPTLGGGLGAMVNRSPTTINNYYPQVPDSQVVVGPVLPVTPPPPTPAPSQTYSLWPLLLLIPLLLLVPLVWYLWPKPVANSDPNWSGNTTIILRDLP